MAPRAVLAFLLPLPVRKGTERMTNRSVLGRSPLGLVVLFAAVSLRAAEEPAALEKRLETASGAERGDLLLRRPPTARS
jgi:hypothetical protein